MEANTVSITTPVTQTVVVLKQWITGADDEAIQAVIEDALSVNADATGTGNASINGSVVRAMRREQLQRVVVSVGSKTDGMVEALQALPARDYRFVCSEVEKIADGETPEKKD